jgi:uroporphyrinogen decarboxylase
MRQFKGLENEFKPNWSGLVDNLLRRGTPERVYFAELFQDVEIVNAIAKRFHLAGDVDPADPDYERWKYIAVQRFCGYDYVRIGLVDQPIEFRRQAIADTAALGRRGGRSYQDEHTGPIMSWADFEKFPWPDPELPSATRELRWYQEHLPEDMCIVGSSGFGHNMEWLSWLMGYETLCYSLFENRPLVKAIAERIDRYFEASLKHILEFDRARITWGSDDMGFKTGLMISPQDMRELVLPGHRRLAAMSHAAGRPYLLHSCGNLADIMEDLIEDVKIDAKHSFEDTIEDVCETKRVYGRRVSLLGGIDVDFLCRSDEKSIRRRVRETLKVCQEGGGYCLGTGNTVANYIPLDNYLVMLDEGRLWQG